MMIIDPVALGDVACTRASTATYFDRNGVLQAAPANTLRVTYDPSDLTKAPHALVEAAATNNTLYSQAMSNGAAWSTYQAAVATSNVVAPDGSTTAVRLSNGGASEQSLKGGGAFNFVAGGTYTVSVYAKAGEVSSFAGTLSSAYFAGGGAARFNLAAGIVSFASAGVIATIQPVQGGWFRCTWTFTATASTSNNTHWINLENAASDSTLGMYFWGAQHEAGSVATSYAPTTSSAVTRAADTIASGAGLVYSNVAITETAYSSVATYAQNATVYDPATYQMYQSLIAGNTGHVLTDTTSWVPTGGSVNRRQMFDQYNNTQTANAEEAIVVVSPQAMARGVYIGNMDASEVRISVVDPNTGSLVYQEVQNLIVSNSGSSFFKWGFNRRRKKSYAVSVSLPPYSSGLITIAIKKPGGTVKCGMCVVGPLVDVGLAQYGLSREIKDYSTVNFNFDGTSNVVKRNYAKIMDVDVIIDNDQIDAVVEALEGYRQKPVAWIGAAAYGSTCLFGAYTSFKSVIAYPMQSTMNLQIQGTV
jgi:hypothetical protein